MIAYEMLYSMKTRNKGKIETLAMKLDMSKAYGMVEWTYLKVVMRKLGFRDKWADLIMDCVRSIAYLVVVIGKLGGKIYPSRWMRQGDPLSSYLLILCAESLSSMINLAERSDKRGVTLASRIKI